MTAPIAALAARACADVVSAARTTMSSIFSSPSTAMTAPVVTFDYPVRCFLPANYASRQHHGAGPDRFSYYLESTLFFAPYDCRCAHHVRASRPAGFWYGRPW